MVMSHPLMQAFGGAGAGSSAVLLGLQIVDEGVSSPGVPLQFGIFSGIVGVFIYFDRRDQKRQADAAAERREADKAKDAEIAALKAKVDELTERIYVLLRGDR